MASKPRPDISVVVSSNDTCACPLCEPERDLGSALTQVTWLLNGSLVVPMTVSAESERFRMRAKQCRELAAAARDDHSRQTLTQMALELDAEADAIEADEGPEMPLPPVDL